MTHPPAPVAIQRTSANAIEIQFDDGTTVAWTAAQLRKACPCATCREKQGGDETPLPDAEGSEANNSDARNSEASQTVSLALPVISQAEARPLTIEGMRPVGQYGYNINFSDGHSSGIFPFEKLYAGFGESNR